MEALRLNLAPTLDRSVLQVESASGINADMSAAFVSDQLCLEAQ